MSIRPELALNVLFDPGQRTCYSFDAKGTAVYKQPQLDREFFSINALHPSKDLCPTEDYHNVDKPRRADGNVVCFRNFLVEIDSMPLDLQIKYVRDLVPVSTITYSGGKSYHFIISLAQPCEDIDEYRTVARRLLKLLDKADHSCKNPSRLSRVPGAIRKKQDVEQRLVFVGKRVNKKELLSKLPLLEVVVTGKKPVNTGLIPTLLISAAHEPDEKVADLGGRNLFFFWLGQRIKEYGLNRADLEYFVDLAYYNLTDKSDFTIGEAYSAARLRR